MWHKAEWMGRPMRLGLTCVGLLVKLTNRNTTRGALMPQFKIKLSADPFLNNLVFYGMDTHTHVNFFFFFLQ